MGLSRSHLSFLFELGNFRNVIQKICKVLKKHDNKFDTIVFRGMSGTLISPTVSLYLRKKMLLVRKQDQSHSPLSVEGDYEVKKYIIIDDCIDSGNTIRSILSKIFEFNRKAKPVGVLLYNDYRSELKFGANDREYIFKNIYKDCSSNFSFLKLSK